MTPEAMEFVTKGSIATVKGFEARAMKAEFRRAQAHATLFATMLPCVGAFRTTFVFLDSAPERTADRRVPTRGAQGNDSHHGP